MDRTCTSCHGYAPNDHDVKLNVDGGLARDGSRRAAAVICRDKNGKYIGVSAIVFEGLVDPATIEPMRARRLWLWPQIFTSIRCVFHYTA